MRREQAPTSYHPSNDRIIPSRLPISSKHNISRVDHAQFTHVENVAPILEKYRPRACGSEQIYVNEAVVQEKERRDLWALIPFGTAVTPIYVHSTGPTLEPG